MEAQTPEKNKTGWLMAVSFTILLLAWTFFRFGGFYYDVNDDVMMRNLLAGFYTGTPEGHNIQMLYPLSALIALCYRILPFTDWYAVFLLGLQAGSVCLILFQLQRFFENTKAKLMSYAVFGIAYLALLAPHVVFVQYSFTSALCSGTAAFLLLTGEGKRSRILSLILLWTAYLLRSEMMLFMLPLVLVAVAFRLRRYVTEERVVESGIIGWKRYLMLLIVLAIGMGVLTLCHTIAYGSSGWKEFTRLFNNRTELYDFHEIPDYEGNREFYEGEIGLSEEQQALLINYNYGLDESIDADLLGQVADYAAAKDRGTVDFPRVLRDYLFRLRHADTAADWWYPGTDAPWNLCVLLLYLIAFCVLLRTGVAWKLLLLFACRTSLWLYLMARGRDPVRITHGLYLVEILVLAGMILPSISAEIDPLKHKITLVITGAFLATTLLYVSPAARLIDGEVARRTEVNERFELLFAEIASDGGQTYFLDVFSWVPVTEKLFARSTGPIDRYDIMGGWVCKSPLYEKKLAALGCDSIREALIDEEHPALVVFSAEHDPAWLAAYYEDRGIPVNITEERRIGEHFLVYRLTRRP